MRFEELACTMSKRAAVGDSPPRFRCAALILLAAIGCSGTCGRKSSRHSQASMPNENLPRDLKPLPEPPDLRIARQSLPGADALSVVTARPRGEVRGEVRPTITFSRPVKSLESLERSTKDAKPLVEIEPRIEGEWKWLGSASIELVPKGPVPYSTRFRVRVLKGLRSLDGNELKQDYTFEFNTPRLELQDVSPVRGYRWVQPQQTFKLLFNQPITDPVRARHGQAVSAERFGEADDRPDAPRRARTADDGPGGVARLEGLWTAGDQRRANVPFWNAVSLRSPGRRFEQPDRCRKLAGEAEDLAAGRSGLGTRAGVVRAGVPSVRRVAPRDPPGGVSAGNRVHRHHRRRRRR